MSLQGNVLVGQSGGPTTVINSSLAGIIETALNNPSIDKIYGSRNGIQGVLENNFVNLSDIFKENRDQIQLLKNTPSMYLGSCRYKLSKLEQDETDYIKIFEVFSSYHIKYFFYIGGNDSMDTVKKLSEYANKIQYDIQIIGIPKTIDNDLAHIDHTPGFGSAAKYIAASVLEIAHDTYIYDTKSVIIIEIMGRNAGWLTAAAALARNEYSEAPHLIYLPEKPFGTAQFIQDVKEQLAIRKQVVIAVSEGIKDPAGNYISAGSSQVDQFGHVMLSGTGKYLESPVQNTIGCKVRSVELNVLQRCASHISSGTDVEEAFCLGVKGVEAALEGATGEMVLLNRISNQPYSVEYGTIPIQQVANVEKQIPKEWITPNGNDIMSPLLDYLRPLILGERNVQYKNGIPDYLCL